MIMETNTDNGTVSNSNSNMVLVEVSASIFPASKRDKHGEEVLANSEQVTDDWYTVQRRRFPESVLTSLNLATNPFAKMGTAVGHLRSQYLYKIGFQVRKGQYLMREGGWHILNTAKAVAEGEIEEAKEELRAIGFTSDLSLYDRMVRQVRITKPESFDPADYPSLEEVMSKWCKLVVKATPNVGPEMLPAFISQGIRAACEADHQAQLKANSKELYIEMAKSFKKVADLWSRPTSRVLEATLENLQRGIEFVEVKNLTDDPEITELVQQARATFSSLDVETIRASAAFRQDVAASALNIAKTVAEKGRRRFA